MKNQGITLIGQLLCVKFLSIMVRFKNNFSTKKVVTLSSITPLKNKFKNSAPLLVDCSRVIPEILGLTGIMATLSLWLASVFIVYLKQPRLRIVVRVAGSWVNRDMLVLG